MYIPRLHELRVGKTVLNAHGAIGRCQEGFARTDPLPPPARVDPVFALHNLRDDGVWCCFLVYPAVIAAMDASCNQKCTGKGIWA